MSTTIAGVAFGPQILQAAQRHGLDPRLLAAVAAQETGGPGSNSGRNVVGDAGHGHGLFQIDDRYHDFARSPQAMDPAANADYAAGMLGALLERYGGNVHQALSAYNAGDPNSAGTLTQWPGGSRLGYADSVMQHYAALGGDAPSLNAEMQAESPSASQALDSLMQMAGTQIPAPAPPQPDIHSWRTMAGVDASGHSNGQPDFTSLVDPLAGSDSATQSV